jgi:methionyl-tRNA formyltransferase
LNAAPRIAFAGTPGFAVPALERLIAMGVDVPLVFTQPDRRAGRGRRLTPSPVKRRALAAGLAVAQPAKLEGARQLERWGLAPDLLVVVAYGLLLPQWMLGWPRAGCINIHASLLPRWRGAAPIQHALMAGDRCSGVTIMRMTALLDAGPILAQRATSIGAHETAGELSERLAELGADLLGEVLPGILGGGLLEQPQAGDGVSYAPKIAKADAAIDWRGPALDLERRVRAFNPWPIAEGRLDDGTRLRIWDALALPDAASVAPGEIAAVGADGIDVGTGLGRLRLTRVQAPSKSPVAASVYARSHRLEGRHFVG